MLDDTPRAFTRLMAFHTIGWKPRRGLDDGISPKKKKKARNPASNTDNLEDTPAPTTLNQVPKILPNEPLSVFSARVNASIPISGLATKSRGLGDRQTKMERRMQRMQHEWREAAAKRKEKAAEEDEEDGGIYETHITAKSGSSKRKRGKQPDGDGNDSDDPWAVITAARAAKSAPVSNGLVGLHDVVQAPPKFSKTPKQKFRFTSEESKSVVGGLRRQEELSQARKRVVEGYRLMMKEKRETVGRG